MNRMGVVAMCVLLVAGCGGSGSPGPDDFTGSWSGELDVTYSCADGSTVPAAFPSENYTISQSGSDDTIAVAFCNGLTLTGGASGNTLSLDSSGDTSLACTQTDGAGNTITINDFAGGSFVFDGPNLDATIQQDVTINGLSCSGTATGVLSD